MKKTLILALLFSQISLTVAQASDDPLTLDDGLRLTGSASTAAASAGYAHYTRREAAQVAQKANYALKTGQFLAPELARDARTFARIARVGTGLSVVGAVTLAMTIDDILLDSRIQDRFCAVNDRIIKPGTEFGYDRVSSIELPRASRTSSSSAR